MSSNNSDNFMQNLWSHIIESHYDYLNQEEGLKKIAMRSNLEKQLRNFLSLVQQDRKFFLPVTRQVLKESIRRNADCSMHRIGMGFVAIHQFASNLYTMAWRPEYRTIRTYSGFYQQEIHSHLCDAELMFKEMGYRLQPNGTLLLKGTPCLDQVANVSRDALVAYVECQIMSDIHAGLVRLPFVQPPPSRTKIAAVREQLRGDVQQTIDALAARYRRPQPPPPPMPPPTSAELVSNNCPQHGHSIYANELFGQPPPPPPPAAHTAPPHRCVQPTESTCEHRGPLPTSGHQRSRAPAHALPHHQHHQHHAATIPHSRSLDQYVERQPSTRSLSAAGAGDPANGNHKRHSSSFDQPGYHDYCRNVGVQQYDEMPTAYTVPANRYPMPTPYAGGQLCAIDNYGLAAYDTMTRPNAAEAARTTTYAQSVRHNGLGGYLDDDVTDLSLDQLHMRYDPQQQEHMLRPPLRPTPVDQRHQPTQQQQQHHQQHQHRAYATTTAATVGRRPVLAQHPSPRRYDQDADADDYDARDGVVDTGSRITSSRGCSDFDSADDQLALAAHHHRHHRTQHNSSSSGVYASKCSDGIGSFASWNYVYTKLEKDGYTKDLGERGDLLRTAEPAAAADARTGASAGAEAALKSGRTGVPAKAKESMAQVEAVSRRPASDAVAHSRANGGGGVGTAGRRSKENVPSVAQTLTRKTAQQQQPPPAIRRNRSPAAITEWSCEHCTLLNPMSVRICAVCSRSKDCVGTGSRTTKATTTCI